MSFVKIISSDTPVGTFHMAAIETDGMDVVRLAGFGDIADIMKRSPSDLQELELQKVSLHPYQKHVAAYFAGDLSALDKIPRHQDGTAFQEKVWKALGSMQPGETLSYKQLADRSGNPAAIRAAGTICGLNKLVLLIPCHRILKSDGGVGNYLYGADMKRFLLQHEGALPRR